MEKTTVVLNENICLKDSETLSNFERSEIETCANKMSKCCCLLKPKDLLPEVNFGRRCYILLDFTNNKSKEENKYQGLFNGWSNRRTREGYPAVKSNENQLHKLSLHENDIRSITVISVSFYRINGSKINELFHDCHVYVKSNCK